MRHIVVLSLSLSITFFSLTQHAQAAAENSPYSLFQLSECVRQRFKQWTAKLPAAIEQQPYFAEFPYKAKMTLGSLRDAPNRLLVNTQSELKMVFPDYIRAQLMAYARLEGKQLVLAHQRHPEESVYREDQIFEDFEYYRSQVLQFLSDQYRAWNLPSSITRTLVMQEYFLAEHRKIEIMVSKQGQLLFYARVKLGSHPRLHPGEEERYPGDFPYIETFARDAQGGPFFYRKRVPTYFLPADLLLKDPYDSASPLNVIRHHYANYGIIEIGRAFTNHSASKADKQEAVRIGFGMLIDVLPDVAPGRDLSRLIVLDTAPPAQARLYQSQYAMTEVADLTPLLGGSILGPMRDILGRTFSDGGEVTDATDLPDFRTPEPAPLRQDNKVKDPKISLMMARGTEFREALQRLVLLNVNLDEFVQRAARMKKGDVQETAPSGPDGWRYK